MLCAILKKPDEKAPAEIEIEFEGKPISGIQRAYIIRPKGRAPKSLSRLSTFSWSRNHFYGYIRLKSGSLYKSEGFGGETVGGPRTLVYLIQVSHRVEISAYCKCGGAMKGLVRAKGSAAVEKCVEVFLAAHQDPGCGPTDAGTARQARRKSEAKATRG